MVTKRKAFGKKMNFYTKTGKRLIDGYTILLSQRAYQVSIMGLLGEEIEEAKEEEKIARLEKKRERVKKAKEAIEKEIKIRNERIRIREERIRIREERKEIRKRGKAELAGINEREKHLKELEEAEKR